MNTLETRIAFVFFAFLNLWKTAKKKTTAKPDGFSFLIGLEQQQTCVTIQTVTLSSLSLPSSSLIPFETEQNKLV